MTLQAYTPDRLDQFALNLLVLAAILREMAHVCREHGIGDLPLHDRKALNWQENLAEWIHKARADLQVKAVQAKAKRRAKSMGEQGGIMRPDSCALDGRTQG